MLTRLKKYVTAYITLSMKYKQRTDGFVVQNFGRLITDELPLIQVICDAMK